MVNWNAIAVRKAHVERMQIMQLVPFIVASLWLLAGDRVLAQADTLAPPKYEVVDKFSVNMATGQVQITQTPLAIGGNMGLQHTISSYTSDFVNMPLHGGVGPTVLGFRDSNRGGLYSVLLSRTSSQLPPDGVYGIRVFGAGFNEDFRLDEDGDFVPFNHPSGATLVFQSDAEFTGHVMTAADGARLYYPGPDIQTVDGNTLIRRSMSKAVFPNGFAIVIDAHPVIDGPIYSVRTNTGFQLKYLYDGSWTVSSPTKVIALNNRFEFCPPAAASCTPSGHWPTATYTWSLGEPSDLDSDSLRTESIFAVTDASRMVTEYRHQPFESETGDLAPRIVQVKKAGEVVMNYDYEWLNYEVSGGGGGLGMNVTIIQSDGIATVAEAWMPDGASQVYDMHRPKMVFGSVIGTINGAGGGYERVRLVESTNFGALVQIDTWHQHILFDYEPVYGVGGIIRVDNTVDQVFRRNGGITVEFEYDSRGNLKERTENGISRSAGYEVTCTASNYKYCNSPKWVEDARGNRTDFTYHPPSGQIASVTKPADESGVRAKTVYHYDRYYAHYKQDSDAIEAADQPIWLLISEKSCENSSMNSSENCAAGDAIVTTYEYDYHNLYLRGVAVTARNAAGTLETHRVCYEYDRYGNRIGETKAKAGLGTCL